MFRTKRSREQARARGAMMAREWISAIGREVAFKPAFVEVERLPPRTRGMIRLVFGINLDGSRTLLSKAYDLVRI